MDATIQALKEFMDKAHSGYHAVAALKQQLEEAGFSCLHEGSSWQLTPGGKYYLTRGGAALIAFRLPEEAPTGFLFSASHADRPTFKLKENPELPGTYVRASVERYGGMLMGTWLDRPLSLAGRVMVQTQDGIESRLVDIDRDLFLIPNVAIHMNRQINDGYKWNPAVDLLPLFGGKEAAGKLEAILQEAAGGKLLGHDLTLYVRQKACVWGPEEEFISAQALDDLQCAWCCTQGFLGAERSRAVQVLCVFDSEEVGSGSLQGADSQLLEATLDRLCRAMGYEKEKLLHHSLLVSADNAHAVHPNHPEFSDPKNAPVMGGGVVIKFNANQRYTTDGASAAIFRSVCQKAGVPVQTFCNRADLMGGSTLGNISLSHVSVLSVDIGLAQLAMHSCYETAGTADTLHLVRAMTAFYGSTLEQTADGSYRLM